MQVGGAFVNLVFRAADPSAGGHSTEVTVAAFLALVLPPREKTNARLTTSPPTSTTAMMRVRSRARRCASKAACWRASLPAFLRSRLAEGTGGQSSRARAKGARQGTGA